jgi:hypothetical protein
VRKYATAGLVFFTSLSCFSNILYQRTFLFPQKKIQDLDGQCNERGVKSWRLNAGTARPAMAFDRVPEDHLELYFGAAYRLLKMAQALETGSELQPGSQEWLPIDDFLATLASRRRSPKLLSVTERGARIAALQFDSVNVWVRRFLHICFQDIAYSDPSKWKVARDQAHEFLRNSISLTDALESFLAQYADVGLPYFGDGQTRETKAERSWFSFNVEVRLKQAGANLTLMNTWAWQRLDDVSPEHGGRPRLKWREEFIGSLAHAWWALTNCTPSANPQSLFADFVEAAWRSGGDHLPELSWERAIRNVCKDYTPPRRGDETGKSSA